MENPKFQLSKDNAGEFRFILKARNGETILRSSEGYKAKQGAQNGISSVQTNSTNDSRYERKTAKDGSSYFVLKAANGEPIGMSEMYKTAAGRDGGIESVKNNAPGAPTEDIS